MIKQIIILGCGSSVGVPTIDGNWGNCDKNNKKNIRTRCSALIKKGSNTILIDTSPDIKQQLLNNKIKDISYVIFTHEHADQTNGIFELRGFFLKNFKKVKVLGDVKTLNILKKRYSFCFKASENYPAIIDAKTLTKNFTLGKNKEKISFKSFRVQHGLIKNTALVFENSAYISDCNDLNIINIKEMKNLELLIVDCLKIKSHPSHFNLRQALYIHNHLKPKKTILTNLHHDLDYDLLLKKLPKNVKPAYDGMKIKL